MEWIIGIVVGLLVGGAACWLVQEFRAKSRLAPLASQHETNIANLKAEHDKAVSELQAGHYEEVSGLKEKIADLNGQLERLPLEHQSTIISSKAEHDNALAELQSTHQKELANLNEQLATQPLEHQAAIVKLRADYDEKVADLQAGHQKELTSLNEKIADLNGQMEQIASTQQMLETAKTQFSEAAKLTAAEALQNNNQQFLDLAKQNLDTSMETAQRELDQRHQKFEALVKPLSKNYSQLTETFQATATSALHSNREQFLELAKENLGTTLERAQRELDQRHNQFRELVKPLADNYGKLSPQIETLTTQVQAVTSETSKLSGALSSNQQVGNWGEVQLRRIVELAGMSDYADFNEQVAVDGVRPDLIVKLPDGRAVVVDSKASLTAHLDASQAADQNTADAAWARHAAALKTQIDALSRKDYGSNVPGSLNFVVMFVPGDQFLATALKSDANLVEYAISKRVAIATPASLIAMLWAVANGWERVRLAQNAESIRQAGEEMHTRMMAFVNHYQRVGKGLSDAVDSYNRSIGSFDQRVVPQGRKFAELVKGNQEEFQVPQGIETEVRESRHVLSDSDSAREAA